MLRVRPYYNKKKADEVHCKIVGKPILFIFTCFGFPFFNRLNHTHYSFSASTLVFKHQRFIRSNSSVDTFFFLYLDLRF